MLTGGADGAAPRVCYARARPRPLRRLRADLVRLPRDDGRDDAADAALPALRAALRLRRADRDRGVRGLRLRRDRWAAGVRRGLRRDRTKAGPAPRARLLRGERAPFPP